MKKLEEHQLARVLYVLRANLGEIGDEMASEVEKWNATDNVVIENKANEAGVENG